MSITTVFVSGINEKVSEYELKKTVRFLWKDHEDYSLVQLHVRGAGEQRGG